MRKKCKIKGHKEVIKNVLIRKYSLEIGRICEDYKAKIKYCSRFFCDERLSEPFDLEYITYWTSVEMPKSCFDKMREDGFLILRKE